MSPYLAAKQDFVLKKALKTVLLKARNVKVTICGPPTQRDTYYLNGSLKIFSFNFCYG